MNCNNCGSLLTGVETTCPNCGNQVVNPAANTTMQAVDANKIEKEEQEKLKDKKPKGRLIGILLAVIGLIIIGIGVFMMVTDSSQKNVAVKKESNNEENSKETTPTSSKLNYDGYEFEIPKTLQAVVTEDYGLVLKNQDIYYTIGIDITNDYSVYKQAYQTVHATNPDEVIVFNQEREYVLETLQDEEGASAASYATITPDSKTFLGMIVKKDFTPTTDSDLSELTNIINSAVKSESMDVENDMGANGPKVYTFTKAHFPFES